MIGVDTNVLVRLLTADSPEQHEATVRFFSERTPTDPAFVSAVTLAETAWVLRRTYGFTAAEISRSFGALLNSNDLVVEGADNLEAVRSGTARPSQIADFLVVHLGSRAGCSHTVTFDRRAAKSIAGMELLA
jgi:predicted nucleic-acid-binding protein